MFFFHAKRRDTILTPINIVFSLHLLVLLSVILGFMPREAVLFVAGILVFFFLFSPPEEGVMYVARSIPFFVALPLTETFDSFNMWRIAVFILFLRWLLPQLKWSQVKEYSSSAKLITPSEEQNENKFSFCPSDGVTKGLIPFILWAKAHRFEALVIIFFGLMILSLLAAADLGAGLRRVIYFMNLVMIYPVILTTVKNKETLERLFKNILIPLSIVVGIGYIQLWLTYKWDFMHFAAFWAKNVELVFYGTNWSTIVYHSNTWFAYLGGEGLRLRVFSIFPDSHSFPIYLVMGLAIFFALVLYRVDLRSLSMKHAWRGLPQHYAFAIAEAGLASFLFLILLTGTRGIWLSVVFPMMVTILYLIAGKKHKNLVRVSGSMLLIFVFLIPFASYLFSLPQFTGGGEIDKTPERKAFFARFKSSFNPEETSNEGRIFIWTQTFKSLTEHPLLGVGVGNFPVVLGQDVSLAKAGSSAHNLYLNIAAEMGIPALIVFLLLLFELLRGSFLVFLNARDQFLRSFSWLSILSLLWILAYSLTDAALFDERAFLMFVVFVGAIKVAERISHEHKFPISFH